MIINSFTQSKDFVIKNKVYFTSELLRWNSKENKRLMPWKGEKDPYKIWLSEIILQQTRVEQGVDYYNRFIATWPTITKLARAPEVKVFKMWEGLGYYARCKNLIATADFIAKNLKGKFPDTYEAILDLKGIGPYTASAISSFAYNLPHAVVDGNVSRVLSRFYGITNPIDSAEGKKIFARLAEDLLDKKQPGIYNQALMDFGATICKPQLPLCSSCPLNKKCTALINSQVGFLPVKDKKLIKKTRWFYYFVIEYKGSLYVRKRLTKDIWENLFEFVLIETNKSMTSRKLHDHPQIIKILGEAIISKSKISPVYRQELSHQSIIGQFIHIKTKKMPVLEGYSAIPVKKSYKLPFPKFITNYLAEIKQDSN